MSATTSSTRAPDDPEMQVFPSFNAFRAYCTDDIAIEEIHADVDDQPYSVKVHDQRSRWCEVNVVCSCGSEQ